MSGPSVPTVADTAVPNPERIDDDRDRAYAILDEAYDGCLCFVADGEPCALPALHARVGDTVYLHPWTGGGPPDARGGGLRVYLALTLLDRLVYTRSQVHHGANHRSMVAHGVARPVTDAGEQQMALGALVDRTGPDRAADSRPPNPRELAGTALLALDLREVSVTTRTGGAREEPADLALPYWAGVVPLRRVSGPPEPDADVTVPIPDHLLSGASTWHTAVPLRGRHVLLEPLDVTHAPELYAATEDAEVWRHLTSPRPHGPDELADLIAGALRDPRRVAWVQRDARTGTVVGSTSYYEPDPQQAALSIGYTFLGRPWWRTGINTEAKLLLLTRAFDQLGAVRVQWHTDVRNERSQRAIERLGASREGVLRRHRRRADGSWRDTVLYAMTADQWPQAQAALRKRLRQPAGQW